MFAWLVVDRDATPDGWREQARTMVESGRCELLTFGTGGGYGSGELTLAAETGYGAELPKISAVTLDDILVIDGREFQIVGVMRPDPWGMFLQVGLQEMA